MSYGANSSIAGTARQLRYARMPIGAGIVHPGHLPSIRGDHAYAAIGQFSP